MMMLCTARRSILPRSLVFLQAVIMLLLLLLTIQNRIRTSHAIDVGGGTYSEEEVKEPIDYAPSSFTVLFPWFIQVIGVIAFFVITRYELVIPVQALMFLIGAACGSVSTIRYNAIDPTSTLIVDELDQLSISILQWSKIDSAVLLLVFLPGLIFRDAIEGTVNE